MMSAYSRGWSDKQGTTSHYHDRQCTYKEYLRDCNVYNEFKEQNFKKMPLVSR